MAHKSVGHVSYHETTPGKWMLRFRDPYTGNDAKVIVKADTHDQARDAARDYDRYCKGDIDERPDKKKAAVTASVMITVEDAIKAAELKVSTRQPRSLKNYRNDAMMFQRYLEQEHGITRWAKVTCYTITHYLQSMKARGCSRDRIRLCLEPVRITSRQMAKSYKGTFTDVYLDAEVKIPKADDPDPIALEWNEAADLIEFLAEQYPYLQGIALLILATGLRQYEAAHIRPCDIDQANRIITLNDTPHHKLKNMAAYRPIPYPEWAFDGVESWPVSDEAPIFVDWLGRPWTENSLAKRLDMALKVARADGIVPDEFTFHNLRHTFATHAGESGVPDIVMQRMMRQRPASVYAKHYRKIKTSEIASKLEPFWNQRLGLQRKSNESKQDKA